MHGGVCTGGGARTSSGLFLEDSVCAVYDRPRDCRVCPSLCTMADDRWEEELTSIVESTSSILKNARVPGRAAWKTPGSGRQHGHTASNSARDHKEKSRGPGPQSDVPAAELSTTPAKSAASGKRRQENAFKENQPRVTRTSSSGSSRATSTKQAAVIQDIKRQLNALEEELRALKSTQEASSAQVSFLKEELHVSREGQSHMQSQMSHLAQQGVNYELQQSNLKRTVASMEDQIHSVQTSIHERSTRGEVNAHIAAAVDPLRSQVEAALRAQSTAVANATATAMAAVHKAAASAEIVEAKALLLDHSMNQSTFLGADGSANDVSAQAASSAMEVAEVRVERRLERFVEDKIELSSARLKELLREEVHKLTSRNRHGGNVVPGAEGTPAAAAPSSTAVIDRVNEVYERVLGLGGKIAEEAQRRHLSVSSMRAELKEVKAAAEQAVAHGSNTLQKAIDSAVSKAIQTYKQDTRREKAIEAQQAAAELERVRSSLMAELEKRDKTIVELKENVERAKLMAARVAKPPGPPPSGTPHLHKQPASSSFGMKSNDPPKPAGPRNATVDASSVDVNDEIQKINAKVLERAKNRHVPAPPAFAKSTSTTAAKTTPTKQTTSTAQRQGTPAVSASAAAAGESRKTSAPVASAVAAPPSSGTHGKTSASSSSTAAAPAPTAAAGSDARPPVAPITSMKDAMRAESMKRAEEEANRVAKQRASRATMNSAPKALNPEVEKVRQRLKEMEAKARPDSGAEKAPEEAPAKPPPKKQCPYCLRKFPPAALPEHKQNCTCRIVACKHCGKGRMARQIGTHERFCDKRPEASNAASKTASTQSTRSKKFKCKHCDQLVSDPHNCEWEPRKCKFCSMQIIARDITKHEQKCASKSVPVEEPKAKPSPEVTEETGGGEAIVSTAAKAPPVRASASSTNAAKVNAGRSFQAVSPRAWTTAQVVEWLSSVGVNKLVQKKFSYHDVDGQLLLEVNEDDLKEDLGVQRKQDRNRLIAAIRSLKAKHGYKNDDSSDTSSSDDSGTDDSFDKD